MSPCDFYGAQTAYGPQLLFVPSESPVDLCKISEAQYPWYADQLYSHYETYLQYYEPQMQLMEPESDLKVKNPLDVQGQVWIKARDAQGSREVQEAFDDASTLENGGDVRRALAMELHSHVWEALKCPHANHVLQKCISTMRSSECQFVIDELVQLGERAIGQAARHRYGCRIYQRLFEHCTPKQMHGIVEILLRDAVALSTHIYGIYVMQHLLEHGSQSHVLQLTNVLTEHALTIAQDVQGPAVLSKALEHASSESRVTLANAILAEPAIPTTMGITRHGHHAAKLALQYAESSHKSAALAELTQQKTRLRTFRYGRALITFVESSTL